MAINLVAPSISIESLLTNWESSIIPGAEPSSLVLSKSAIGAILFSHYKIFGVITGNPFGLVDSLKQIGTMVHKNIIVQHYR